MLTSIIGWKIFAFIPEKFRKGAVIAIMIALAIAGFFIAKALYDRSVIEAHDNNREATIAKADRKADATAAEQRLEDVKRQLNEVEQQKEAIDEARTEGRDARAAYYDCIRLQQAARREHKPPPDC